MITNELKELVREEARNLREKATKEELAKLDFEYLWPHYTDACVYGLMTGNCHSERSIELMNQCAPVFIEAWGQDKVIKKITAADHLNEFWSPIEDYIIKDEAKNYNLILYLKGETDTLEL